MFGFLAGVRETDPYMISLPRGLPYDISVITKLDAELREGNSHSHSFIDAGEIKKLWSWLRIYRDAESFNKWPELEFGYLFGNGWDSSSDDLPESIEDVRFVFWFDN